MTDIRDLLQDIFNHDFPPTEDAKAFKKAFFGKSLTLTDLKKISALLQSSSATVAGRKIPAAIAIPGNRKQTPFILLAQLHGNEPAGLAGIALAMALSQAGKLERDVIGVVGNPLAAQQYFDAWSEAPTARQEMRDAYRCGLSESGDLLPDMNRIPVDFSEREADNHHTKRAQELWHLGENACGILDMHTARGDMVCITDYKFEEDLKYSPIRRVLTDLADAISAHASGVSKVQTLKTILSPLDNIQCQIGIEAGRHEDPKAPSTAAAMTLAVLYRQGFTKVTPLVEKDNGVFDRYAVRPRISYADLEAKGRIAADDKIYMAMVCDSVETMPKRTDRVVIKKKDGSLAVQTALEHIINPGGKLLYALYQYNEMEAVKKGQVLAVALPSGTELCAPFDFSGIFLSKSAALYDKDPAVGPWPVDADKLDKVKFCYPCEVSRWKLSFKR